MFSLPICAFLRMRMEHMRLIKRIITLTLTSGAEGFHTLAICVYSAASSRNERLTVPAGHTFSIFFPALLYDFHPRQRTLQHPPPHDTYPWPLQVLHFAG